jgi:O-antigen ligase
MLALVAQAALTFSRSGLYMAAGGAAVTAAFAMSDVRLRARFVTFLAAAFVVGNFFVVPYLDAFTGGAMGVRFQDTDLTGRDLLIQADIDLWTQNPVLGVGPGEGKTQRGAFFSADANAFAARGAPTQIAAHTEFSRMLAEHGSFGFGALLLFVTGGLLNVRRAPDARARAVVAALASWSALFMLSTAMRVVAPSLAFGIGFAIWLARSPDTPEAPVRRRQRNWLRPLTAGHPARRLRVAPESATSME